MLVFISPYYHLPKLLFPIPIRTQARSIDINFLSRPLNVCLDFVIYSEFPASAINCCTLLNMENVKHANKNIQRDLRREYNLLPYRPIAVLTYLPTVTYIRKYEPIKLVPTTGPYSMFPHFFFIFSSKYNFERLFVRWSVPHMSNSKKISRQKSSFKL